MKNLSKLINYHSQNYTWYYCLQFCHPFWVVMSSCIIGMSDRKAPGPSTWWYLHMETFSHCWPFVWGIHLSPVNSPHKGQWCRSLMFSLICIWTNAWVNSGDASDLRCHCTHYDITVMGYVPCGSTRQHSLDSSTPGQIGCHFTDDIFRCIFVNEKFCILIKFHRNLFIRVHWCINAALGEDELKIKAWWYQKFNVC